MGLQNGLPGLYFIVLTVPCSKQQHAHTNTAPCIFYPVLLLIWTWPEASRAMFFEVYIYIFISNGFTAIQHTGMSDIHIVLNKKKHAFRCRIPNSDENNQISHYYKNTRLYCKILLLLWTLTSLVSCFHELIYYTLTLFSTSSYSSQGCVCVNWTETEDTENL